jgi:hypothetical protein
LFSKLLKGKKFLQVGAFSRWRFFDFFFNLTCRGEVIDNALPAEAISPEFLIADLMTWKAAFAAAISAITTHL